MLGMLVGGGSKDKGEGKSSLSPLSTAAKGNRVDINDVGVQFQLAEDLSPRADGAHFDGPALRILGARYAQAYLRISN